MRKQQIRYSIRFFTIGAGGDREDEGENPVNPKSS